MKASLLLSLLWVAHAEDRGNWEHLYDHLLIESIDGDIETASSAYRELIRNLPADASTRAEALYWLGRAEYSEGNAESAQQYLKDAVRAGTQRRRSLELLGQIALEQTAIRTVPTVWTFDGTGHGIVHPWRYMDKGTISTRDNKLIWATTIDQQEDILVVGFNHPKPSPAGVRFKIRATPQAALLQITLSDTNGQLFLYPENLVIPASADFVTFDLPLAGFQLDDTKNEIEPRLIDRLIITDISGKHGFNGLNEIQFDEFKVY